MKLRVFLFTLVIYLSSNVYAQEEPTPSPTKPPTPPVTPTPTRPPTPPVTPGPTLPPTPSVTLVPTPGPTPGTGTTPTQEPGAAGKFPTVLIISISILVLICLLLGFGFCYKASKKKQAKIRLDEALDNDDYQATPAYRQPHYMPHNTSSTMPANMPNASRPQLYQGNKQSPDLYYRGSAELIDNPSQPFRSYHRHAEQGNQHHRPQKTPQHQSQHFVTAPTRETRPKASTEYSIDDDVDIDDPPPRSVSKHSSNSQPIDDELDQGHDGRPSDDSNTSYEF